MVDLESNILTCDICYSSQSDYPDLKFVCLDLCNHSFCSDCFSETYRSLIEDQNALSKIKCPQYGCEAAPSEEEIQRLVPPEVFDKYLRYKMK